MNWDGEAGPGSKLLSVQNEAARRSRRTSWNQFGQLLVLQTNSQVWRPPPQNIFNCNQCKVWHTQTKYSLLGKLLLTEQDVFESSVSVLCGFEIKNSTSLSWQLTRVGGWVEGGRGVVEPFFGRQPHVLVSYLLSTKLMQPCIDCYIHDVQGTAWAWLWSRIIAGQVARLTWDSGTWFGEADQIIAHMESSNLMIYIIPFKSKNENDIDRDTQGYFLCYILEERCRLCVCAKKYISRCACAVSAMIRVGWMMADAGRSLPFTLPALSFDPVHRPT